MKNLLLLVIPMVLAVLPSPAARLTAYVPLAVPAAHDQQPKRSPRVWVNLRSAVYHCPGSKWYGIGKRGAWMTEADARAKGYRAAYKRACGT
jgi:hypothetical protein